MTSKDKETGEWLHTLAAGHMGGIAGNPNEAAVLDAYQRLIKSKTGLAVLSQCATKTTLKGANNGR
ncbi:hypothetical protein GFI46_24545 [Salmonella enterica subsp. enterica]|nr:hypothetical protein [Salmonella enterica subsp. enterica serovar Abony]EDE2676326.1 hypothetical protein [Salmonella enterica subsp. enterica serovar Kottbus]ELF9016044.1 hypothetical protein [Salmonella enterica]MCZ9188530.1 hypothetical protein [Escherichia albertii]HAX0359164.1 hypothetical protein [Escherichia coli]